MREVESLQGFEAIKPVLEKDLPEGVIKLGTTLVLTRRSEQKGGGVKARICAQDFATTKRDDVFSPTPNHVAIRVIILLALQYGLDLCT